MMFVEKNDDNDDDDDDDAVSCTDGWTTVTSTANVEDHGLPAGDLQRLQSVFNASVRLVSNSSSRCHATPLLRDRHCCPSDSMCSTSCACYSTAVARRGTILSRRTSRSDLHRKQQKRSIRLTQSLFVAVPRTHSTLGDRAFSVAASSLEQPPSAHKTYILHGSLLKELEIFPVFMCIL